jgi:hypothetical protein
MASVPTSKPKEKKQCPNGDNCRCFLKSGNCRYKHKFNEILSMREQMNALKSETVTTPPKTAGAAEESVSKPPAKAKAVVKKPIPPKTAGAAEESVSKPPAKAKAVVKKPIPPKTAGAAEESVSKPPAKAKAVVKKPIPPVECPYGTNCNYMIYKGWCQNTHTEEDICIMEAMGMSTRAKCKFGDGCNKRASCGFAHPT